ncbi:hypothetical protein G9A89_007228 [Geosiphon pyriformis]|nr:hypothetical protein G9A89_007228 [Geosiphon pyriformis]
MALQLPKPGILLSYIFQKLLYSSPRPKGIPLRKSSYSSSIGPKSKEFTVLGIETSCDDTGVGIVRSNGHILSDVIQLQQELHEPMGGIVPTLAMQAHQSHLPLTIIKALNEAKLNVMNDIDVIAATRGPGLSPCLNVGLIAGKVLAAALRKPLIGVHHMASHALTVRLTNKELKFPFMALLISGGHTLILIVHGVNHYTQLGTTLDDSIGEAYDKIARFLKLNWTKGRGGGLGEALEKAAFDGDPRKYSLPTPMTKTKQTKECPNLSFSGLKTSTILLVEKEKLDIEDLQVKRDIAAAFQFTAIQHLINKLVLAFEWCKKRNISLTALVVSGGVARNKAIRMSLEKTALDRYSLQLICPAPHLCSDNGVMIAWAGVERYRVGLVDDYTINHIPKWPIENLGSGPMQSPR